MKKFRLGDEIMVPPMERGGYRKTRLTFLTKGQDRWIRSCLCQLSSQFD